MFLKGKPKKGNFSYFGIRFLGFENRVFVRGVTFWEGCFWGGFVYLFIDGFVLGI